MRSETAWTLVVDVERIFFPNARRSGDTETAIITCPAQNSLAAKRVIHSVPYILPPSLW